MLDILTRQTAKAKTYEHLIFWLLLAAVIGLGVAQTIPRLNLSLNVDEPFTANLIQNSYAEMFALLRNDNSPALHYILLKPWAALFGESEVALRLPSVICFALTILIVGVTGQRMGGAPVGLLAALLVAISTRMGVPHAATARMYALLALLIALACLLYFHLIGWLARHRTGDALVLSTKRWQYALLALVNILGLFTHPIYVFFMGGCTLAALWLTDTDRLRRGAFAAALRPFLMFALISALSVGLYLLIWLPLLRSSAGLETLSWLPRPTLEELELTITDMLWGTDNTRLIGLYLGGILLFYSLRAADTLVSRPVLVGMTIIIFGVLVPFLISYYTAYNFYFRWRTPIIVLPTAALTLALFMRRAGAAHLTLLLIPLLIYNAANASFARQYDTRLREQIDAVISQLRCGDVLVYSGFSISEVEYYLRYFDVPDCHLRETFPLSTAAHPGWIDQRALYRQQDALLEEAAASIERYAADHAGSRLYYFYGNGAFMTRVNDLLRAALDARFEPVGVIDTVSGWGFDEVLVYEIR